MTQTLIPSSAVYDVMKARGLDRCVLPVAVKGLNAGHNVCGRAFTVEGEEDHHLTADETLLRWSELLSRIPPESVVVCQPHTHHVALMGELSAHALRVKNVNGYVVDGACRDAALVEQSGLPVFCTHLTPRDIVGRWTWQTLGEPVRIGDVKISRDDLVVGDRDGVVVVPHAIAEDVLAEAEAAVRTESAMRKAILSGMDAKEAYLIHKKF